MCEENPISIKTSLPGDQKSLTHKLRTIPIILIEEKRQH